MILNLLKLVLGAVPVVIPLTITADPWELLMLADLPVDHPLVPLVETAAEMVDAATCP